MIRRRHWTVALAAVCALAAGCSSTSIDNGAASTSTAAIERSTNACELLGRDGAAALTDAPLDVAGQGGVISDGLGQADLVRGDAAYADREPHKGGDGAGVSFAFGAGVNGTIGICSWRSAGDTVTFSVWYAHVTEPERALATLSVVPPDVGCPIAASGFEMAPTAATGDIHADGCAYGRLNADGTTTIVLIATTTQLGRPQLDAAASRALARA